MERESDAMARVLVFLVALGAGSASAQSAADGQVDRRIRCVTYDAEEVVEVAAVVGVATHIVVEVGEVYLTHAFGDAKGWDFAQKANHFFLKPLAANADCTDGNLARAYAQLLATRPTAINLKWALDEMRATLAPLSRFERTEAAYARADEISEQDVAINSAIFEGVSSDFRMA